MNQNLFEGLGAELQSRRCVVVVGLPGTGKSLLVREAARLAKTNGRAVRLLQWDVARTAWDTPEVLARFPEVDGVTHAGIRKALGLWVRKAMLDWFQTHAAAGELLLVEAPIIGGRFAELAKRGDDSLESHLAGPESLFVVVAPTTELQAELRRRRAQEMGSTRNALEQHNASVVVLDGLMAAVEQIAPQLGQTPRFPGM